MTGAPNPHPSSRGRRTTDADRARRNAKIVAARASGETWPAIAERFGLSHSQVRQIVADHRAAATSEPAPGAAALDVDPNEVFMDVIGIHRDVLDGLALLGREADNDSARVGALRARATTAVQMLQVLAAAGSIPDSPGRWRAERDVHHIARGMLDAVAGFDARVRGLALPEEEAGEPIDWDAPYRSGPWPSSAAPTKRAPRCPIAPSRRSAMRPYDRHSPKA